MLGVNFGMNFGEHFLDKRRGSRNRIGGKGKPRSRSRIRRIGSIRSIKPLVRSRGRGRGARARSRSRRWSMNEGSKRKSRSKGGREVDHKQ